MNGHGRQRSLTLFQTIAEQLAETLPEKIERTFCHSSSEFYAPSRDDEP